jgi:Kdo2-lipid IVA lauroyltransferase/acyltransferase
VSASGRRRSAAALLSRAMLAMLIALSRLPYPVLARLGEALGTVTWWFAARRRRIALVNLRLCFPQMPERQRRRLAHEHFRWFMRSFVERFIFWFGPPQRIAELVRIEGEERFEACLGRPLIILAPHFVGIDGGGMRLAMEHPYVTVYGRQKNAVLDEAMHRGRTRFPGAIALPRHHGVRAALRHLRRGLPFYYLPDMDLGSRDAVFVPFFGVPAATVTATARLAQLTGAAVLPYVTRMTADGYVGTFYPAWEGFPGDDPVAATRRMNEFIEQRVLEMPAQYLWTHRRFKTRPPGERNPYRKRP